MDGLSGRLVDRNPWGYTSPHVETLGDTPTPTSTLSNGAYYNASNHLFDIDTMALLHPITLRRLKCFVNEPTHICPQIHAMQKGAPASRLPTPTNTLPSKPKKDTYAPTFHKPYAALIIETSHHALPNHSKHIFCTVEFCTVDCAQSNLPIRWSTLHLQIHALQRTVKPLKPGI